MSDRIFELKKAGTSTFSNPSLVSATTPTLANLVGGFDIANKASIQTSSEVYNRPASSSVGWRTILGITSYQKKSLFTTTAS